MSTLKQAPMNSSETLVTASWAEPWDTFADGHHRNYTLKKTPRPKGGHKLPRPQGGPKDPVSLSNHTHCLPEGSFTTHSRCRRGSPCPFRGPARPTLRSLLFCYHVKCHFSLFTHKWISKITSRIFQREHNVNLYLKSILA